MILRSAVRASLSLSISLLAGCGDDDAPAPADAGTGLGVSAVDEVTGACGKWVRANFKEQPPEKATSYGMEYNDMGTFSQYVCRFRDQLDGKEFVLQGKGVFGFSCYAILPAGARAVARVEPSDDFEVLTETESCARMVAFTEDQSNGRWLPTGTDVNGNPTYTCHGIVRSLEGGTRDTSTPLGRYEAETKRCVFEWYSTVRAAPAPGSTESFEMLAVP